MNHTKYERRYEIYEYIICMYRQHTNINSESKVKPKEKEDCNLHFTEVLQDLKKKRNHSVKIEYLI